MLMPCETEFLCVTSAAQIATTARSNSEMWPSNSGALVLVAKTSEGGHNMEHGIVPRPKFTRCPTAYAVSSQQGNPVSDADRLALQEHDIFMRRKSIAASERQSKWAAGLHEYSPRTRKGM